MAAPLQPIIMDIYIPYCISPEAGAGGLQLTGSNAEKNAYLAAVGRELLSYEGTLDGYEIHALRLSGPGATVMSPDLLGKTLRLVREHLPVRQGAEVSVNASPVTIGTPALTGISAGKPNRFDLMMRSASDEELRTLGCRHTMQHVNNAIMYFNRFHMNNLALTVNFGIPGQTEESWHNTLHACTIIHPAHISVLPLHMDSRSETLDKETRYAMYSHACAYLKESGYIQYGAGLFCLPHHGHLFELLRTEGMPMIGIGLGAVTRLDGYVTRNTTNRNIYISGAGDYQKITAEVFEPDKNDLMKEYVNVRLCSTEGLQLSAFERKFSQELPEEIKNSLDQMCEEGLLEASEERYVPTLSGFFHSAGLN